MHRIGLLLFDQVDLLDVGGPYEVFLTANRLAARGGTRPPFEVVTVARRPGPLEAYGGLGLVAGHTPDDVGELDVLVVPGTIDVDEASEREDVRHLLTTLASTTPLLTSVCTGSILMARAGLLDGVAGATTHHEDVELLAESIGAAATTARWVDTGAVVTAGGLSDGLALALHLVDRLVDRDLASATAAQLAYDWDPEDGLDLRSTDHTEVMASTSGPPNP